MRRAASPRWRAIWRTAAGCPLVEVDRLLWLPGWQRAPEADYARRHAEIVAQDRWVIDGLGRQDSIPERLARSIEIVLIDMPLWMHFSARESR